MTAVSLDYIFLQSDAPNAWIFRRITSCINFAASPLIPILLYRIFRRSKCPKIYYLPSLLNIIICIFSMFSKVVFSISEQNTYGRGRFFFLPIAVSIFYLVILIQQMRVFSRRNNRSEQIFLSVTIGALLFCMYLEIAKGYILLDWACVAISLILYYLLINVNSAILDPLTEAYNRAMYMKRLSEIQGNTVAAIGLIDINNFKMVNDQFGHDAGDKYLISLVQTLQKEMDKGSRLYRIGGDEFAVISGKWTDLQMKDKLSRGLDNANKQDMDFAFGVAQFKPGDNLDEILNIADKNMYLHKKESKMKNKQTERI